MHRFSVITITYNAEKYLEETLASVASQKFTDYEHIIWDGGSRDRTGEIVKAFPHIKFFQGGDEGIADAMNRGAAQATGEFLLHLHADDLLAHDHVFSYVDVSLRHHAVSWLYGQAHIIDGQGKKVRTTPFETYTHQRLQKYNFITHPATFIRRSLFEKVGGFHKKWKYCMDYALWLRLAEESSPFALASPLACFREHEESLSTAHPLHVADEAYEVRHPYQRNMWRRFQSYRTWKKRLCSLKLQKNWLRD